MKLFIAGLLLVMLECCTCKPFELRGGLGGNVGASMKVKDGVRVGLDGDVDWRLAAGKPESGPAPEKPSPVAAAPSPNVYAPYPYDPRAVSGYNQPPGFGYYYNAPYGYDQRPVYEYERSPSYAYDRFGQPTVY